MLGYLPFTALLTLLTKDCRLPLYQDGEELYWLARANALRAWFSLLIGKWSLLSLTEPDSAGKTTVPLFRALTLPFPFAWEIRERADFNSPETLLRDGFCAA
jgi:hypothetical protein